MPTTEITTLAHPRHAKTGRGVHMDPVDDWYSADFVVSSNGASPNGVAHARAAVPAAWPMTPDFEIAVVDETDGELPMPVRCLHGDPADWE